MIILVLKIGFGHSLMSHLAGLILIYYLSFGFFFFFWLKHVYKLRSCISHSLSLSRSTPSFLDLTEYDFFFLSPSVWPVSATSEALPQEPKSESETTNCTATTAISDSNVREQIREKISCLLRRPRVPMHFPEPATTSPSSSLP